MPIRMRVKWGGVPELLQRMSGDKGVAAGMQIGANAFAEELRNSYPPEGNAHRPQAQYWDDKTRRGFFYHLKHGDIQVPYKRTDFLANHWQVKARGQDFLVTNSAPKASLVQGRFRTQYHKITGWKTPKEIWEKVRVRIGRRIKIALIAYWLRGGRGKS